MNLYWKKGNAVVFGSTERICLFVLMCVLGTSPAWADETLDPPQPVFSKVPGAPVGLHGYLPNGKLPSVNVQMIRDATGIERDSFQLMNESIITLPHSTRTVQRYKVRNQMNGQLFIVAFDTENSPVDYKELQAIEKKEKFAKYGSVQPAFYQEIEAASQSRMHRVLIKMAVDEEPVDRTLSTGEQKRRADIQNRAVAAKAQNDFNRALKRHRLTSTAKQITAAGPFIVAELAAADLMELARDPSFVFIGSMEGEYVEDGDVTVRLDESLRPTKTKTVQDWYGLSGSGVQIGIIEAGQPGINNTSIDSSCFNTMEIQSRGGTNNAHLAKGAGLIGNNDGNFNEICGDAWVGYAPGADLLFANANHDEFPDCPDYVGPYMWAREKGADVITMSWHCNGTDQSGDLSARDIFFDYWSVHYPYPAVFASAGNTIGYSCGKGYNFFGVGNMDFNTTLDDRCDDQIEEYSGWINPTSPENDRELPEIASPGDFYRMMGNHLHSGTSAATPATAAVAALLIEANSLLGTWPEAIRAILLASANYQGGDGQNWHPDSDGHDGAGLTNAYWAYHTAKSYVTGTEPKYRGHDFGAMRYSDFSWGQYAKTWTAKNNNAPIRVALTWNSKNSETSSELDADLDLWLVNSWGTLVAESSSYDGNVELLEYTATAGDGDLTIKIIGADVPQDLYTYYSIAWTNHYDYCD